MKKGHVNCKRTSEQEQGIGASWNIETVYADFNPAEHPYPSFEVAG
jgi:hypothetical protein